MTSVAMGLGHLDQPNYQRHVHQGNQITSSTRGHSIKPHASPTIKLWPQSLLKCLTRFQQQQSDVNRLITLTHFGKLLFLWIRTDVSYLQVT